MGQRTATDVSGWFSFLEDGKTKFEKIKEDVEKLSGIVGKRFLNATLVEYLVTDGEKKNKKLSELQMLVNIKRNFENFSDSILLPAPSREKPADWLLNGEIGNRDFSNIISYLSQQSIIK